MNVTELARKLKMPTKELLEILPAVGFDIGRRAIKIDNRQAQKIVEQWPQLLAQYKAANQPEEKAEEKAAAALPKAPVAIGAFVQVKDFANKLGLPLPKVMAEMMKNGVLSSINEQIDFDTASIVGSELGFEIIPAQASSEDDKEKTTSEKLKSLLTETDETQLKLRPPVVVVMGHVDHGKTKLLDAIRSTKVMEGESGGITQHIGAYQAVKNNRLITFIDTPGHEAFTTMRSRGARVADIAILVIAADDSIQPQTKESIKIIHSAGLPMVVAINKIDKPDANIDRVKQDLAAQNLIPEDYGGKTITVPISAKTGEGIDELLEMILLASEAQSGELRANPERLAVGTIVESHVDKGQGPVATVLIQNGTLHRGDHIMVSDTYYGKIRSMKNFKGEEIDAAPPSMPVQISGMKAAPSVGDVLEASTEVDRKTKINKYDLTQKATAYSKPVESSATKEGQTTNTLNVIIKADVLGSLEAIISALVQMEHPEVSVNIIAKGLGNITEGDVRNADAGHAWILGFHVKLTQDAERLAAEKKVDVTLYDVIYHLIEEVRVRLEAMLVPEIIRTEYGTLKVLAIFRKEKDEMIIGGTVTKGEFKAKTKVDIIRNDVVVGSGEITGVQMNKVAVTEVTHGKEGGVSYHGKPIIQEGDSLLSYTEEVKKKTLR